MKATLHFDGSANPNPGPNCRCGYVVTFEDLAITDNIFLGSGTNNTAEYDGLIHGMMAAIRNGISDLEVFGDSNLVINAMNHPSRQHKKHPHLQSRKEKALEISAKFDSITFEWIPREQNAEADQFTQPIYDR
jgi:ribonuclease HI